MGLISDIETASASSLQLEEAVRQGSSLVLEVGHLLESGQQELSGQLQESQLKLSELESFLVGFDSLLTTRFSQLSQAANQVSDSTKALRTSLVAELDANDQVLADLAGKLQTAFDGVGASVKRACEDLQGMVVENNRLIGTAEAAAAEAETRAREVEAAVESQRQSLEKKSNEVLAAWKALEAQMLTQLNATEAVFTEAAESAKKALKTTLDLVVSETGKSHDGAKLILLDQILAEFVKLSQAMTGHLAELKSLADRPRQLTEQDLTALTTKLANIVEPLRTIDRIFQKAKSLEI